MWTRTKQVNGMKVYMVISNVVKIVLPVSRGMLDCSLNCIRIIGYPFGKENMGFHIPQSQKQSQSIKHAHIFRLCKVARETKD